MNARKWKKIHTVYDQLQAELLRGLLEANNFEVLLSQEGAARAMGLSAPPFGEIEILVPSEMSREAERLIEAYYRGDLEEPPEE